MKIKCESWSEYLAMREVIRTSSMYVREHGSAVLQDFSKEDYDLFLLELEKQSAESVGGHMVTIDAEL